jgi:hypothetical protein
MPALTEQDEAYLTHVLSITATKLETIYVEAMAALERYFGKPKRQHRSLWRNGSGNGREQCFGLIRRVMSTRIRSNSILCCE